MPRVAGVTVGLRAETAQFQADMRNAVGITNRTVNEIKGAMGHLNTFLGAHLGMQAMDLTVGKIVQVGDAYTSLVGRLKNATNATGDFNRVYQQLFAISQKNGVALETSVSAFQGMARAAGELGASSAQILRVTDTVQKLGIISGASTESMKNGMQQFQQALAGSVVHAEEWNSIVENMPAVADAVAKSLGKSFGEVRQMVIKQKLSSDEMFQALLKAGAEADRQFAAMPRTVAMAQAKMNNTFGKLVHDLDDATGATKRLAAGMGSIADEVEKNSPKIVQYGRTLGAFMGVLQREWEAAALSAEMQQLGFTADQQIKYLGALRKKSENQALYDNYDFGQGPAWRDKDGKMQPGENGIADVFGPNRPGAAPHKKIDEQALKKLEDERKEIEKILKARKEEKEVLEGKLKGYDDLRIKYEQEKKYIESTTLGTKEKAAALQKLSAEYNIIAEKTAFIKKQEEQKKAIEDSKEFLEKARAQRQELEAELDGRVKLTKTLAMEVEYKKMLAEGNKGSKEAQKNIEDAGKELEATKRAEAAEKSAKLLKESQAGSEQYGKSIMDQAKAFQQLNEDMDMRLHGEEQFIQFAHARQDLEDQTQEILKKKYETLKKIQELEALSPNNISLANDRKAIEKEINDTLVVRNQALANINESQDQFLQQTAAIEKQRDILESITTSTVKYKEKISALDDALNRGWITTEQYNETLKKLNKTQGEANKYAEKFADAVGNAFEGFIAGGESAQDTLKKLGKELAVFALRTAVIDPLKKKFVDLFSPGPKLPQVPAGVGPLNSGYTWNTRPAPFPGQYTYSPNGAVPPPMLPNNAQPQTSPAFGFPWAGPSAPVTYNTASGGTASIVEAPTTNAILMDILLEMRLNGKGRSPFGFLGDLFGNGKDFLGGMWSGMFGGGTTLGSAALPFAGPSAPASYRKFAKGGYYSPSMGPAKIGEMGEEMFFPNMPGWILPNWLTQMLGFGGQFGSMDLMNGPNPWNAHLFGGSGFLGGSGASKYGGGSYGGGGSFMGSDGQMYNEFSAHLSPGGMLGGVGYGPGKAPVSSFTHGMGGESTDGMISNKDHAYVMMNLMKKQYEENYAKNQNGTGGMGGPQLQSIYDEWKRYENEYMNGGRSQSRFQNSQFLPQWEMYNETARLDYTGRSIDIEQYLPDSLKRQNTGQRWGGFQAYGVSGGGMGGEIGVVGGGGFDMPQGIQTSNFNNSQGEVNYQVGGGGQIVQMNQNRDGLWSSGGFMNGANNTGYNGGSHNGLYNNGDLRSAHDYGSYRDPLIRNGGSWGPGGSQLASGGGITLMGGVGKYDMRDPFAVSSSPFPDPYDKGYPRGYVPESNARAQRGSEGAVPSPTGAPGKFDPDAADRYLQAMGMLPGQLEEFIKKAETFASNGAFQKFVDEINVKFRKTIEDANHYRGFVPGDQRTHAQYQEMSAQELRDAIENYYKPMIASSKNPAFRHDGSGFAGMGNDLRENGAGAMVMPGNVLPVEFADMMPVQLESQLKNLMDGWNIVDGAKPNIMPGDWLKDWGMQLANQYMEKGMWKGDRGSLLNFFRQYMGSNWSNRHMQPWQIPGAARLFGYAKGGRYKANQPMAVGENGLEIMIPETAGKVVSNSQIRDAVSQGGGQAPQMIVNTYTRNPVKVTEKRTPRGVMAIIEDATDQVMQRPGRMSRRLRDSYGVSQQPIGKS